VRDLGKLKEFLSTQRDRREGERTNNPPRRICFRFQYFLLVELCLFLAICSLLRFFLDSSQLSFFRRPSVTVFLSSEVTTRGIGNVVARWLAPAARSDDETIKRKQTTHNNRLTHKSGLLVFPLSADNRTIARCRLQASLPCCKAAFPISMILRYLYRLIPLRFKLFCSRCRFKTPTH